MILIIGIVGLKIHLGGLKVFESFAKASTTVSASVSS
jgi:hypothetical protein